LNMPSNTVYVVTGANRGLGLGLVKDLLLRPHTTIVATVRNADAAASLQKEGLSIGDGSVLHVLILDLTTAPSPEDVRNALAEQVGDSLGHIDVLINNAGICPSLVPTNETLATDMRTAYETNAIAPLMIFQGLWPLLQKAAAPKVIMVTSSMGCIGGQEPLPGGSYGPSKAAQNWITRSLHLQNVGLIAVALHPGWVQTRAGFIASDAFNYNAGPPLTVEQSVTDMLKVIDNATRESIGGKLVTQTGDEWPW
jgi:NAD(P)-dependent dehydrogenase (short-subunit alcohol dehydrogenase family)